MKKTRKIYWLSMFQYDWDDPDFTLFHTKKEAIKSLREEFLDYMDDAGYDEEEIKEHLDHFDEHEVSDLEKVSAAAFKLSIEDKPEKKVPTKAPEKKEQPSARGNIFLLHFYDDDLDVCGVIPCDSLSAAFSAFRRELNKVGNGADTKTWLTEKTIDKYCQQFEERLEVRIKQTNTRYYIEETYILTF